MEKINIAELLKDCPQGMELDCTMFDDVTFDGISNGRTIVATRRTVNHTLYLDKYGCPLVHPKEDLKCVIFPKGKTTWEGFVPPCKFKDGDVVVHENGCIILFRCMDEGKCGYYAYFKDYLHLCKSEEHYYDYTSNIRHATEEEKQKLFDVIKANGYKWNDETKTLEKLIVSKFKVGDRIRNKISSLCFKITYLHQNCYIADNCLDGQCAIDYIHQDQYELVSDKFDITTLKPYESRVLVRNSDSGFWKPAFWGIYETEKSNEHQCRNYLTTEGFVRHCIPYNDETKHLVGKTSDCPEYYKTWEE